MACQINGLFAPGVLLIRTMFRLHRIPEPDNGVKSFEKAERRRAFIVPGPIFRMFDETFQLLAVRPAGEVPTLWKLITAESKLKSPWNPTRLSAPLIAEVVIVCVKLVTAVLTVPIGRLTDATRTGGGVGDGEGVVRAMALELGWALVMESVKESGWLTIRCRCRQPGQNPDRAPRHFRERHSLRCWCPSR